MWKNEWQNMTSDCCQTLHPNVKVMCALETTDTIDAFRNGGEWSKRKKNNKTTLEHIFRNGTQAWR